MTDVNAAAFPQPKPTIAEILIEGATTDQPGRVMAMRIAELHPKATLEEIDAATAAAQDALAGRQESPKPTEPLFVPVAHVVDRLVNETLDAIGTSETGETQHLKTWTDAMVALVNQHPSKLNLISWLAVQGIESELCSAASERDLDYAVGFGSPLIEATEADVKHSQAMVEEYEELRRSNAKSS
jgi:hypothetical protein